MIKRTILHSKQHQETQGQAAIEYLLLLMMAVVLVLFGFKEYFPKVHYGIEIYYNNVAKGIVGQPSHCGNGVCEAGRLEDDLTCCMDCPAGSAPSCPWIVGNVTGP